MFEEVKFTYNKETQCLVDGDNLPITAYTNSWKFRPIDYEYLNKIGNESWTLPTC